MYPQAVTAVAPRESDETTHHGEHADLLTATIPGLALFVAVADTGGVTAAAAKLGISQPTASRMLARLQQELNTDLVMRHGRGLRLTPAGHRLLPHARRAVSELADGFAELEESRSAATGEVSLAFLHTLGPVFVPDLVSAFRRDHPAVMFTLVQDTRTRCLELLREGEVELALVGPMPEFEKNGPLTGRIVEDQPLYLTVPVRHPLASLPAVDIAEAAEENFVDFTAGMGIRSLVHQLCAAAGFEPRSRCLAQDPQTARGLVSAGLGVAILPASDAPAGTDRGGVVDVPIVNPGARRTIGLVWAAHARLSPASRAFRHLVLSRSTHGALR